MSKGFVYQEIGKRIRELRGNERQKDWASRIGCDQGYISQVENGVTKPSLSFLRGVASMTNASIDWILTGRGDKVYSTGASYSPKPGAYTEDTLKVLQENPRLLMAVDKILRMDEKGRGLLEALCEMDERKLDGLALFMGVRR